MEALTPMVQVLFNELGRQYEVLIYEQGRRANVSFHRVRYGLADVKQDRLDELLTERIKVVEAAMKSVTDIMESIKQYNILEP